jgi:AraC-like DNA-binding protein
VPAATCLRGSDTPPGLLREPGGEIEARQELAVVRNIARHRHLAGEGTTFRLLVDELRTALAEEMLSHRLSVAEVAERLGYAEVASFSHAFKRWKGAPPAVYRARA